MLGAWRKVEGMARGQPQGCPGTGVGDNLSDAVRCGFGARGGEEGGERRWERRIIRDSVCMPVGGGKWKHAEVDYPFLCIAWSHGVMVDDGFAVLPRCFDRVFVE